MVNKEGLKAGELVKKAQEDRSSYNSLEVGQELSKNVLDNVWECIDKHKNIINEDEFCVCMLICEDNLIKGVMRIKYYAWPFLPKPRPNQVVFHYSKKDDKIERLWSLPNALSMARITQETFIPASFQKMKFWVDAFYRGDFHRVIRKDCNITLESESEYLKSNKTELLKYCGKDTEEILKTDVDFEKLLLACGRETVESVEDDTRPRGSNIVDFNKISV